MKCVVNWIPLRIHVRLRNTQPYLNENFEVCDIFRFFSHGIKKGEKLQMGYRALFRRAASIYVLKLGCAVQELNNRTLIGHEPLICGKMCFTKTKLDR